MMFGLPGLHDYFECAQCGCLQLQTFPSDIQRYYEGSYYSHQPLRRRLAVERHLARMRNKYAVWESGRLAGMLFSAKPTNQFQYLEPLRSRITFESSILDVGCGVGARLNTLREIGFRNLLGVDPFLEADVDYENGVSLRKQFLADVQGQYDLIMFHHSFEHVPDPLETLLNTFRLLRPGACGVIRMPTVSSYAWKHYGVDWVQIDAPRHFHVHSLKSMQLLAQQAGLEHGEVVYDSRAFQFWGSEQHKRGIPLMSETSHEINPSKSIFTSAQIQEFQRRSEELNAQKQGDQAIFYLYKPERMRENPASQADPQ